MHKFLLCQRPFKVVAYTQPGKTDLQPWRRSSAVHIADGGVGNTVDSPAAETLENQLLLFTSDNCLALDGSDENKAPPGSSWSLYCWLQYKPCEHGGLIMCHMPWSIVFLGRKLEHVSVEA